MHVQYSVATSSHKIFKAHCQWLASAHRHFVIRPKALCLSRGTLSSVCQNLPVLLYSLSVFCSLSKSRDQKPKDRINIIWVFERRSSTCIRNMIPRPYKLHVCTCGWDREKESLSRSLSACFSPLSFLYFSTRFFFLFASTEEPTGFSCMNSSLCKHLWDILLLTKYNCFFQGELTQRPADFSLIQIK